MDWITGLQNALDYIEENLDGELDYAEIARRAYSSSFHFQRVFGILCGYTLGEYIRNRRLTLAGAELASSGAKVIDVALKYGYDSPESFARAFARFHGVTPSRARARSANLKSFSRLSVKLILEGGNIMDYRIVKTDAIKAVLKKERFQGSEDPGADISRFWGECTSDGTARALCEHIEPNSAFGGALLGVCYSDPKEGDYDYAIGAAYTGGEPQNGLVVEEIPANTWAVFKCVGPMPDAFTNLCRQIYTEFFPTSEYQPSGEMCIEVYFGDDVTSENYACEYWISVRKR